MTSPGLYPTPRREPFLCVCGEPLTLECEFDDDEALCLDCRAERARKTNPDLGASA